MLLVHWWVAEEGGAPRLPGTQMPGAGPLLWAVPGEGVAGGAMRAGQVGVGCPSEALAVPGEWAAPLVQACQNLGLGVPSIRQSRMCLPQPRICPAGRQWLLQHEQQLHISLCPP